MTRKKMSSKWKTALCLCLAVTTVMMFTACGGGQTNTNQTPEEVAAAMDKDTQDTIDKLDEQFEEVSDYIKDGEYSSYDDARKKIDE